MVLKKLIFLAMLLLSFCDSLMMSPAFNFKTVADMENTSNTSTRLDYIDNLLSNLYETMNQKKSELENPEIWPKDYAAEALKHGQETYDYIVIGAGSAGSVVASRLSEDPDVKVLVLEAGGDPPLLSEIHSLSMLLQNTPYTWNDYAEPNSRCCQAMKGGRCYWPRGKMIGGTGGINGNVFLTGRQEDFDEWQQQGNEGWSWQDIYPFYEKATKDLSNVTQPMGSLTLNYFQHLDSYHILKDLMLNASEELEKWSNSKSHVNITATIDKGKRMSTGKTYLGKVARARPNLNVIKQSVATKLIFNHRHRKVVGLNFLVNNSQMLKVKVRREIILSAGTFNTPKLLMLSGVGPSHELNKLNITVVKNLQVGENLQDHGMMPLILKFNKNKPPIKEDSSLQSLFDYFIYQKGPLASSSTFVDFINTLNNGHKNKSDVMLVTQITKPSKASNTFEFLQFKDELTKRFLEKIENQTVLQIQGLIIKSKSRGSVKLKSSDPLQSPLIYNNYAAAEEDRLTLLRYIRYVQQLTQTGPFQYYGLELITIPLEECDLYAYDSNRYWLCYIKYFYISAWHAVGTCRMGPSSDPTAVVDSHLRVHGLKGLRVIDASIMPNITSANTNGPTIMIAERGSQLIKDDWSNNIK